MLENKYIAAIILAAGKGKRIGRKFKPFIEINRQPLIFYSLDKLILCNYIQKIVITVPPKKQVYARQTIKRKFSLANINIIIGGTSRTRSTYYALRYLDKYIKPDYVIIHDAVRPIINLKSLGKLVRAAIRWGGAAAGTKSIDLVFLGKNGFVTKEINKDGIFDGYTPQCFHFRSLWSAYKWARHVRSLGTADAIEIFQKFSKKLHVKIIEDFYPNPKLTYPVDKQVIQALLGFRKKY